jgi:tetratricopeptide (TPR) repeat protein
MGKNENKNWSLLICLALAIITFAVFYQVYRFEFVNYDDPVYVTRNSNIQNGITFESIKWAFSSGYACNWHPLTWLSHMLDWQLFGDNAGGHHLVNLIFHIANTLLVFLVLKQITGALWQSAFVAALFALHPLHVESVAWVAERKDVLSTFFWFLVIWAYVRYVRRPKVSSYLLIVVFLALGLMTKPMLVTLPFVLLLLDYWPLNRLGSKRPLSYLFIEKIPLFVIVFASSIVTYIVQEKGGAVRTIKDCGFPFRLANALISYFQYIIKMIWPARLAIFYPHPGQNVSFFYAVMSAGFLLIATILILRFSKNHRYLFTGWFWYLGTLVPVIGLVQVGEQAFADRYSYVTLTGLFIIIAWGLPQLLAKWRYRKVAFFSSAILIISVMSLCTYFQLHYWKDRVSLFQRDIDVVGDNHVAHFCIATPLYEQGRIDEAVYHCSEALRLKPDWDAAMNDLAWFLAVSKGSSFYNPDKALELALRACELTDYNQPEMLDTLAVSYAAAGNFGKAVEIAQKALVLCGPDERKVLKEQIKSRLVLFKVGKPYVEPKKTVNE